MRGCCHVLADLVFVPEANPCIKSILKHNFLAFIQDYCTAEIYPSSCLRSAQVIKTHTRKQSDASSGPASYIAPSIFCSSVVFLSIQTTTHIRFNRGLCLWMPFFFTWSAERRCLLVSEVPFVWAPSVFGLSSFRCGRQNERFHW